MKNKIAILLCFLTLGVFILIFLQGRYHLFELKKLNGVYYTPEQVELTLDNFYYGRYQKSFESDLRYSFGFREPLIRLYNQYRWDFYHKSTNYTVKIGKDDWLFGLDEVENYYESAMYKHTSDRNEMKRKFDREAQRMYKVQNILEEYGVFIFVSILPSKAFILPEYLPANPGLTRKPFHAFQYYPHVFDSLGVNYINVEQIFENQKDKVDYPLFPKTGMHWSYIAAEHAFDTTLRYVESKSGINLRNYTIGEKYTAPAKHPDTDLEDVLNLMRPIRPNTLYYADAQIVKDSTAAYPIFIIIGDSFFWNISGSVPLGSIFKKFYYWYYNSTINFDSRYTHTNQVDILEEILNAGIIEIAYSPRQLYLFSNNFLPKALLYLTHEDSEIDSVLNTVSKEELFAEPEKYFPDLATDGIPTTRNSRIQMIINQ